MRLIALCLLLALAACDRSPQPEPTAPLQRGTALPPPGFTPAP